MDGETNLMLSSYEWAVLQVLTAELAILEIKGKNPKVRMWMEKRVAKLKEKMNGS